MNILLVTSDEVAKELLPILHGKGWNTLTSSRDMLIENALRFSPDYLLIQSDSNAMHYRGILTKLYRQGIKPFIIFFDISDRPTFATSKRLDEPYIFLYAADHLTHMLAAVKCQACRFNIVVLFEFIP